jgi:hypothetical protein
VSGEGCWKGYIPKAGGSTQGVKRERTDIASSASSSFYTTRLEPTAITAKKPFALFSRGLYYMRRRLKGGGPVEMIVRTMREENEREDIL